MGRQLWALVVLKAVIFRNTMSTGKALSLVLGGLLLVLGAVFSLGIAGGLFYTSAVLLQPFDSIITLLVMDGVVGLFLFLWLWSLLMEVQRSEIIDLRKMLYLPISLHTVFGLNFIVSLFSPTLLFFVPGMIGLVLGLSLRHGAAALWGIVLGGAFFLMLSAWAYYIRGILAILMENKRRRRLVLTVLPLTFVMLAQLPNVLIHHGVITHKRDEQSHPTAEERMRALQTQDEVLGWVVTANAVFPPGWLPMGQWYLLEGEPLRAAACFGGLLLVTAAGLALGYRSTVRYYTGASRGRVTGAPVPKAARRTRVLTGRRLPGFADDTASLCYAAFLSYLRHPNIRMLLIMPVCLGLFFLFVYGSEWGEKAGRGGQWLPYFVLLWPFLNFGYILLNVFGIDRESFRAMVLLPAPRHKY
ncbi:MAG: hypothetical protein HYZ36_04505, partial [Pedosphaera parvula]|nr:hypothetical protein [Pedosphaera parvula]